MQKQPAPAVSGDLYTRHAMPQVLDDDYWDVQALQLLLVDPVAFNLGLLAMSGRTAMMPGWRAELSSLWARRALPHLGDPKEANGEEGRLINMAVARVSALRSDQL